MNKKLRETLVKAVYALIQALLSVLILILAFEILTGRIWAGRSISDLYIIPFMFPAAILPQTFLMYVYDELKPYLLEEYPGNREQEPETAS